jgi:hypothetical protein
MSTRRLARRSRQRRRAPAIVRASAATCSGGAPSSAAREEAERCLAPARGDVELGQVQVSLGGARAQANRELELALLCPIK